MALVVHQTGARTFADCPAKYAANRERQPRWEPFRRGSAIHLAAQRIIETCATHPGTDLLVAGLAALDEWQSGDEPMSADGYASAAAVVTSMLAPDSGFWWGLPGRGQACRVEYEWFLGEDFQPRTSEDGAAYGGIFDWLEWPTESHERAALMVRDYKSGYQRVRDDDLAHRWQPRVYGLAALALFPGIDAVTFELWNLRVHGRPRVTLERGGSWESVTKAWLATMRKRMLAAEESGEFPATPGDGCGQSCSRFYSCPEMHDALLAGAVAEEINPHLLLAAKQTVSALDGPVRAWAQECGPIEIAEGKVLGFRPTVRKRIACSARTVIEQLRADEATDEDLDAAFPADRIGMKAVRDLYDELATRPGSEIHDPAKAAGDLIEEVPSATFTTFAPPAPDEST